MALTSGTKLGSYEISDLLGKGGMGEVYRARDTKLGREVAIKVLPSEFATDEERLARLEREARMLAALNHPNIAAIHGLEESDGTRFLVLELVEGDTLADRLKRGAVPVEESLKLALQIAEALEAAHEKGVIHRDLKPANIKVTPDGKLKVLDFGLAKAFEGEIGDVNLSNSPTLSMQATQQGVILGTAAYMSPEQAKGRSVDQRTDVWALGAVLYEMLTGRQAFQGDEVSEILASVLARQPDYALLQANLSSQIQRLIRRCLEKEPKTRWQAAGDVRIEIQEALADPSGLLVRPAAETVHAASQSRLPWVAAVVLALGSAGAVWLLTPEPPRPLSRFEYFLPENVNFRNISRPALAISPDGSKFAYNAGNGIYLRFMGELEARIIAGTEQNLTNLTFSPDGEWLSYWSRPNGQLQKVAVVGGAPVPLTTASFNPFGISWTEDGRILYQAPEGIMSVSEDGGEPELLVPRFEEGLIGYPQLLPGGNAVLFQAQGEQVGVHSIDAGESRLLFQGSRPRYVATGHIIYQADSVLFAVPFDIGSLDVTGGPVPMVEDVRSLQYAVSDSGSLISIPGTEVAGDVNAILAWVDRAGAREQIPVPPRPYRHLRISPDGTRVALEIDEAGQSDIWVYDLDGSTQMRQLTGEGNNTTPIWTPDGERLTFASDRDGTVRIYWQAADLTGVAEPLTPPEEGVIHEPDSWSPDGPTLSFSKLPVPRSIWTLSLDENGEPAEPEPFFGGTRETDSQGSAFSPDGGWLAYRSNIPDNEGIVIEQLYVQPFPATGTHLQVTQAGGSYPMWSHDGTELFYRPGLLAMNRGVEPRLLGVSMTLDPAPVWSEERAFQIEGFQPATGRRDYDITPDDERFIMAFPVTRTESGAAARPSINVVLNWFEELKERVPVA